MTTTAKQLPVKGTLESIVLGFDFSSESAGVSDPTFQIFVEGQVATDANPALILSGDPEVSVASVLQRVAGGVDSVNYRIQCTVNTIEGDRLTLPVVLPVRLKP